MKELEATITETEIAIANCQKQFADAAQVRARGKEMQADYDSLTAKLAQLEAEYFARENK